MNILELTDEQVLKIHQYYLTKYYEEIWGTSVSKIIYHIALGEYTIKRSDIKIILEVNLRIRFRYYTFRIEFDNPHTHLYIVNNGGRTVDEYWLNKALK